MLEALVTLVIISAGLLGLAGLQTALTREADASRQRGEATRLAQARIETIRSFRQIGSVADLNWWSTFGWNDLPASALEIITSSENTSYTRRWALGGAAVDTWRPIRVEVSWVDRASVTQSVVLNSVIAKTELAMSGGLGAVPRMSSSRIATSPKNRHQSIPLPAVDLGNGQSAYGIRSDSTGDYTLIFDNQDGSVVKECDITIITAPQIDLCPAISGHALTGHVSRRTAWESNGAPPSWPEGISLALVTGIDQTAAKCRLGAAIDQDGSTHPSANYKYYLCLLPIIASSGTWSGTVYLAGMAGSNTRVCRHEFKSTMMTDNERNVQPYVEVGMSLSHQNYMVVKAEACAGLINAQDAEWAELREHQDCTESSVQDTQCPAI